MITKSVHNMEYIWIWTVKPSTQYGIYKESGKNITKSVHNIEYIWIWTVQPSTQYEIDMESI